MNYASMAEIDLLASMQSDEGCVQELLRRYRPMVAKAAASFDVPYEEGVQQGEMALMDAVTHFDPTRGVQFSKYATVCVTNRLKSFHKTWNKQRAAWQEVLDAPSTLPTPEEEVLREEMKAAMKDKAKEILSPFEYAVWNLRVKGFRYDEIAVKLSTPRKSVNIKSVNNALVRVRNKMRGKHD